LTTRIDLDDTLRKVFPDVGICGVIVAGVDRAWS